VSAVTAVSAVWVRVQSVSAIGECAIGAGAGGSARASAVPCSAVQCPWRVPWCVGRGCGWRCVGCRAVGAVRWVPCGGTVGAVVPCERWDMWSRGCNSACSSGVQWRGGVQCRAVGARDGATVSVLVSAKAWQCAAVRAVRVQVKNRVVLDM
jgi:hypothetical protein